MSKRAASGSDYLLAGLVICARCGKRYLGNAAHGNRYRYRYYTCFSRHRYGSESCASDRLPADELDRAVLDALLTTYEDTNLFQRAICAARERAGSRIHQQREELAAVEAEVRKAEDAIERYLTAFESGTLSAAQLGTRVQALGVKVAELRMSRQKLADEVSETEVGAPSEEALARVCASIREVVASGPPRMQKALLQALVHEVRVEGRQAVTPWFRVPTEGTTDVPAAKVRPLATLAGERGFEPRIWA
jgi:site-specific DNA recombinase